MQRPQSRDELLREALGGDEDALAGLLLDHFDELNAFLKPKMPAQPTPSVSLEDVIGQTFFEAFRDFSSFQNRPESSFSAWLKAIAHHRLLDATRKFRRVSSRQVSRPTDEKLGSCRELIELLPGHETRASVFAHRADAAHHLRLALDELSDDYRDAVILYLLEEKSLDDVAEQMGRTRDSVRGLLQRAKAELRGILGTMSRFLTVR